jgi:hypothetical protein
MLYRVVFLYGHQLFGNILYLVGMAPGMKNNKGYYFQTGGLAEYGHVAGRGKIEGLNGFTYLFATDFEPVDDAFFIKRFVGRNDKFRRR